MACSCDSCSSPRIIKTRTAQFWRWLAESRGETADRVILAPVRERSLADPSGSYGRGAIAGSAPATSAGISPTRIPSGMFAELQSG